ncbi:glutamate receptor ionotropic, kainate 2-like [Branchiostoma floridae]|uniref:Glutamate receptor ionotropic, kainate 2-like n=2 Tax=Branchiostoma floridae TaxID=7739 RepID=A0A9J7HKW6_BRAFL|nr:glutamate receptor ionotropic, kainate 2-like [Branchiostoma floridae]
MMTSSQVSRVLLAVLCIHQFGLTRGISIGVVSNSTKVERAVQAAIALVNDNPQDFPGVMIELKHQTVTDGTAFSVQQAEHRLIDVGVCVVLTIPFNTDIREISSQNRTKLVPRFRFPPAQPWPRVTDLYMAPLYGVWHQLILDLMTEYSWRSAVVLYDDSIGLQSLERFSDAVSLRGWLILMASLNTKSDLTLDIEETIDVIKKVRKYHIRTFILHCRLDVTKAVLELASDMLLLNGQSHWIITHPDIARDLHVLGRFVNDNVLFTALRLHRQTPKSGNDLEDDLVHDAILAAATGVRKVLSDGASVERTTWCRDGTLLNSIRQGTYPGRTGVVTFDDNGARSDVTIWVLEPVDGIMAEVGTWTKGVGFHRQASTPIHSLSFAFPRRPLRVAVFLNHPWVVLKKDFLNYVGVHQFQGLAVDTLKMAALRKNFTVDVYMNQTSSVAALRREAVKDRADIYLAAKPVRPSLLRHFDVSPSLAELGYAMYVKRPEQSHVGIQAFLRPFSYEVWAYIGISYMAISLLLSVVNAVNPYEWFCLAKRGEASPQEGGTYLPWNSLWNAYGAFAQQGAVTVPQSFAGRFISGAWWFFMTVIVASYTANLAAFLTGSANQPTISSLTSLANRDEMSYGWVGTYSINDFMRASTTEPYATMWKYTEEQNRTNLVSGVRRGLSRTVQGDKYAFITSTAVQHRRYEQLCHLQVVGQKFFTYGFALLFPKGSVYKDEISWEILYLRQEGYLEMLEKQWLTGSGEDICSDKRQTTEDTGVLGAESFMGLFMFLAAGVGIGMVIQLVEVSWFNARGNKRKHDVVRSVSMRVHLTEVLLSGKETTTL